MNPPPPYQAQSSVPTTATVPAAAAARKTQSTFYHVYRSHFGNYNVLLDDQTPSFYINSRKLRVPDLVVHRGNGDYDREVANCNFPEFTNHYEINLLLEPNDKYSLVKSTKMTSNGRFTATAPDATEAASTAQRSFRWNYTSSLMLINEETGQTAAIIHGMVFGLKKCFVLEIQGPYSSAFELLVVTTAMGLYEKKRREQSGPFVSLHAGPAARAANMFYAGGVGGAMIGGAPATGF